MKRKGFYPVWPATSAAHWGLNRSTAQSRDGSDIRHFPFPCCSINSYCQFGSGCEKVKPVGVGPVGGGIRTPPLVHVATVLATGELVPSIVPFCHASIPLPSFWHGNQFSCLRHAPSHQLWMHNFQEKHADDIQLHALLPSLAPVFTLSSQGWGLGQSTRVPFGTRLKLNPPAIEVRARGRVFYLTLELRLLSF